VEIDPECLNGENYGPLRLLLELNDRLELPLELRISSRSGVGRAGAVAKVVPIRVWPREFQLDSRGNLAPFFGPPAPPPAGPSIGPMGPSSSHQQLRQQPHYFNLAFPPRGNPTLPGNRQRPFDPLGLSSRVRPRAVSRASRPKPGLVLALVLAQVLSVRSAARHAVPTPTGGVRGEGPATGNNKPLITYQRRRLRIKSTSPAAKDAPALASRPRRRPSSST
jgi:hypothetical protein